VKNIKNQKTGVSTIDNAYSSATHSDRQPSKTPSPRQPNTIRIFYYYDWTVLYLHRWTELYLLYQNSLF